MVSEGIQDNILRPQLQGVYGTCMEAMEALSQLVESLILLLFSIGAGGQPGHGGPEPVPPVRDDPLSPSDHAVLPRLAVQGGPGLPQ